MKSFLMKPNSEAKLEFADIEDQVAFGRLLSSLKRKGIAHYKMTIELVESKTVSEKQVNLFNVLISKVAQASGQDRETIKETLLKDYGLEKEVRDFSGSQFQELMDSTNSFLQEFFNITVSYDKNGFIEIKQF